MKCSAVLWLCAHAATAALIRSSARPGVVEAFSKVGQPKAPAANATDANSSALADEALNAVVAIVDAHKARTSPASPSPAAPRRAKLDVGFTDFEKDLAADVATAIRNGTDGSGWTEDARQNLIQNVTVSFSAGIKEALKPVKQSVGKTWMALPEDEQKNEYISQLKNGFGSILASFLQSMVSHMQFGFQRLQSELQLSKKSPPRELLERVETTMEDGILSGHCYGGDSGMSFVQLHSSEWGEEAAKKTPATAVVAKKARRKFCMPSKVQNFAKHLNDTQMLISMTMRFEARAMDLAQMRKK